jgi:hypothetical protein
MGFLDGGRVDLELEHHVVAPGAVAGRLQRNLLDLAVVPGDLDPAGRLEQPLGEVEREAEPRSAHVDDPAVALAGR